MIVSEWMTKKPMTIGSDTSIVEAHRVLREYEIRHLPVVDADGKLLGLVSDHDIGTVVVQSLDSPNRPLGDVTKVMTEDLLTVRPEDDLATASLVMHNRKIGCLPVVDGDEVLVGIITTHDLLEVLVALLRPGDRNAAAAAG